MSMRKNFRFALEIDGVNHFLIQEIQAPDVEMAVVAHGSPGNIPDSKTAGKQKVGQLVVKMCKPEGAPDSWSWNWMALCVAGLAQQYQKTAFLCHLAPDGITVIEKYYCGKTWPSKISPSGLKSQGDGENIIDTVTFEVERYFPTSSPLFVALFSGSAAKAGGLAASLGKG